MQRLEANVENKNEKIAVLEAVIETKDQKISLLEADKEIKGERISVLEAYKETTDLGPLVHHHRISSFPIQLTEVGVSGQHVLPAEETKQEAESVTQRMSTAVRRMNGE